MQENGTVDVLCEECTATDGNCQDLPLVLTRTLYRGADKPDLLPDVFCLMVRIFRLMLVLFYIYIYVVLIFLQL